MHIDQNADSSMYIYVERQESSQEGNDVTFELDEYQRYGLLVCLDSTTCQDHCDLNALQVDGEVH